MPYRVGIGHDTHRLAAGKRLMIGGVEVSHEKGALAHSDGDVLLHATIDAILGALGLGDVGEWFPDTDSQFLGIDSAVLLNRVMDRIAPDGWHVVNFDCVIFAQKPKLFGVKEQMRDRLAALLRTDRSRISVKAKTGEHVGPIGREEAIAAEVVVLMNQG